jgi:hypothetical protein
MDFMAIYRSEKMRHQVQEQKKKEQPVPKKLILKSNTDNHQHEEYWGVLSDTIGGKVRCTSTSRRNSTTSNKKSSAQTVDEPIKPLNVLLESQRQFQRYNTNDLISPF